MNVGFAQSSLVLEDVLTAMNFWFFGRVRCARERGSPAALAGGHQNAVAKFGEGIKRREEEKKKMGASIYRWSRGEKWFWR
jgi:hypothetical protein